MRRTSALNWFGAWFGRRRRSRVLAAGIALVLAVGVGFAITPSQAQTQAPGNAELAPSTVDQNAGSFATSVAIEAPAFHGIEPKLALAYSSGSANGILGLGWQLVGSSEIERTGPRRGTPAYNNQTDVFHLDGQPLTRSAALGGTHVTMRQSFRRITFNQTANAWYVWTRNGLRATYAARLTVTGNRTLRWMLSRVEDPHGNAASYGYACFAPPQRECYLNTVSYNQTVITLYRESRPDVIDRGVGLGGFLDMAYRIKTIDVTVGGARARVYRLRYQRSTSTGRSLLTSVTRYGDNARLTAAGDVVMEPTVRPLPPVTFDYPTTNAAFTGTTRLRNWCGSGASMGTGDVNGDSRADLWCADAGAATSVAASEGDGAFATSPFLSGRLCAGVDVSGVDVSGLADVDGDGMGDLWCRDRSGGVSVALARGGDFSAPLAAGFSCSDMFGANDLTGDGMSDLWCHDSSGRTRIALATGLGAFAAPLSLVGYCASAHQFGVADVTGDAVGDFWCRSAGGDVSVALSDGAGQFTIAPAESGFCGQGLAFGHGDVNGDGRDDVWCRGPGAVVRAAFSDGNGGWLVEQVLSGFCGGSGDLGASDFNGDRRSDFWCRDSLSQVSAALSDETGYAASVFVSGCAQSSTVGTADLTGDGRADIWCHDGGFGVTTITAATPAVTGDVLTTVTGELGGITRVTYVPASTWPRGTPEPGLVSPPAAATTVSTVVNSDGRGVPTSLMSTVYRYRFGRYDLAERRMLGFLEVTADSGGGSTVSTFRVKAGYPVNRVTRVDQFSVAGHLLGRSITGYDETLAAGVYTSQVGVQTHSACTGATLCQTTRTEFVKYDAYGNLVHQLEYGDVAVGGDERFTETIYLPAVAFLADRVWYTRVFAGTNVAGTKLTHTVYGYNGAGDRTSAKRWLDTTNAFVTTTAEFDAWGNQRSFTDENLHTSTTTWDLVYHLYPEVRCNAFAQPQCTTTRYNPVLGVARWSRDVNGGLTSWEYDEYGRRTNEVRPDGSWTATAYVNWGDPRTQYVQTTVSDHTPVGLWKREFADGLGRTYKAVSKPDRIVLTDYNEHGQVWRVSNPFIAGATPQYRTYDYDALSRPIKQTHPDGTTVTTSYEVRQDAADADYRIPRQTVTTCNELNECTRIGYDGYQHPKVVSEFNGVGTGPALAEYRTHAGYDLLGNNTWVTDSLGSTIRMWWDSLGRKTDLFDPDLGHWTYGYDAVGNLRRQTDGAGHVIVSDYDEINRLTGRTNAAGAALASFRYDEVGHGAGEGHLTSMTDTTGHSSWSYDSMGRVTSQTQVVGGTSITVGQSFNNAGKLASVSYPNGEIVHYGYGADGCLIRVGGYVTNGECTPTRNSQTLGNSVVLEQNLDPRRMWLSSDTATIGATVLQHEIYRHYDNGKIQTKTSRDAADQWTYHYDHLGRLRGADNTTQPSFDSAYVYDQTGRMLAGTGAGARTYPAPGHAHAPDTVGGVTYSYDGAGNLLDDGVTSYTYTIFNRMRTSTRAGVTTTYGYDGQGNRVSAGATTFGILGGQVLYQVNGVKASSFYYYGSQRIARRDSDGTVSYYVANSVGTPHLILDEAGAVRTRSIYSPYGTTLLTTGMADPFGQAGDYFDAGGTYQRGSRNQAPGIAIFTTPDNSGNLDPGRPQTLNRYAYALNDPVNTVDHAGRAGTPANVGFNLAEGELSYSADLGGFGFKAVPGYRQGEMSYEISFPDLVLGDLKATRDFSLTTGPYGLTKYGFSQGYRVELGNGFAVEQATKTESYFANGEWHSRTGTELSTIYPPLDCGCLLSVRTKESHTYWQTEPRKYDDSPANRVFFKDNPEEGFEKLEAAMPSIHDNTTDQRYQLYVNDVVPFNVYPDQVLGTSAPGPDFSRPGLVRPGRISDSLGSINDYQSMSTATGSDFVWSWDMPDWGLGGGWTW